MTEVTAQSVVVLDGESPSASLSPLALENSTGLPVAMEIAALPDGEEAIETVTDSAVEIASIEAAKEVAIAEIHADTALAIEEQITERVIAHEEGKEEWRENMEILNRQVQDLTEQVGQLLAHQSTPPALAETEELTETISIPQSISDATKLTPMEAIGESVAESLEEAPAPARRRRRAI